MECMMTVPDVKLRILRYFQKTDVNCESCTLQTSTSSATHKELAIVLKRFLSKIGYPAGRFDMFCLSYL